MSICRAYDVAYVRFGVPDLGVMKAFLTDFGLMSDRAERDRLFMRGYGPSPFVHVSELRPEPSFLGFGLRLSDADDLRRVAEHDGARVSDLDGPGGGKVVRLGATRDEVLGPERAP